MKSTYYEFIGRTLAEPIKTKSYNIGYKGDIITERIIKQIMSANIKTIKVQKESECCEPILDLKLNLENFGFKTKINEYLKDNKEVGSMFQLDDL